MRPGTDSPAAATASSRSRSKHLLSPLAARSLSATPRTHVAKRSPPPASPPAPAGVVQPFRTSDLNTLSVPHALFLQRGIALGHPPFLAPTRSGSPASFPALSGKRLANPEVFLDFAAAAASVPGCGSAEPARRMFPRGRVGFRSAVRTASRLAKKHRFADRISPPAGC